MASSAATRSARLVLWIGAVALLGLAIWLRAPSFGFKTWNVDEAIHATVATSLRDGGVLYRDTIDQRTPLTYIVLAGIFAVAGDFNLHAAHVFLAGLIAITAALLSAGARRVIGTPAALWAAALYPLLGSGMFFVGDAHAFVTEWFVAFFSTTAAWCYFAVESPNRSRLFVVGMLFAGSFLSKQPGALDLAAPAIAVWWSSRDAGWRSWVRSWGLLALGFALPVVGVVAYYTLRGALGDVVYYTWTYNTSIYGPEIGTAERLSGAFLALRLLASSNPLLCALFVGTVVYGLFSKRRESPNLPALSPGFHLYLAIWFVSANAGAASGGRGFDHYAIQVLPPLCLVLGLGLGRLSELVGLSSTRPVLRTAAAIFFVATLAAVTREAVSSRYRTLPVDPSRRVAEFISTRSAADERIFVWGYQPDIYLFAERRAASRFVYASFLSGLVPWTNVAPERDTQYAIVPGAMDTLLRDLHASRPTFIVDCSAGPNRFWAKYPLAKFPALAAFVAENYVAIETAQFGSQGFRLFAIRDSFRPGVYSREFAPRPPSSIAGTVGIFHNGLDPVVRVSAQHPEGQLARLELLIDGSPGPAVTLLPGRELTVDFPLPASTSEQSLRVRAMAQTTDGATLATAEIAVPPRPPLLPSARLAGFAIPFGAGIIAPVEIAAPFGAESIYEDGAPTLYAHAPSRVQFALPDSVSVLRGAAGFRPSAFGDDNRYPTDGADFRVDLLRADGTRLTLWRRELAPRTRHKDRQPQPFLINLPAESARRLELIVEPGRYGSPASDWSRWTNLQFETSR